MARKEEVGTESRPTQDQDGPPRMPDVLREPVKDPRDARKPAPSFTFSTGPMAKVWAIGIDFGAYVAGGALIGVLLDYLFKTSPVMLLVFAGIGLVGGFSNFVRQSLAINRKMSEQGRRTRAEQPADADKPPR